MEDRQDLEHLRSCSSRRWWLQLGEHAKWPNEPAHRVACEVLERRCWECRSPPLKKTNYDSAPCDPEEAHDQLPPLWPTGILRVVQTTSMMPLWRIWSGVRGDVWFMESYSTQKG